MRRRSPPEIAKRKAARRRLRMWQELLCLLGTTALVTGLTCFDWRIGLVAAGAIQIAVGLVGLYRTRKIAP
jgi:hypothetical protein